MSEVAGNYWLRARKARKLAHEGLDLYIDALSEVQLSGIDLASRGTDADDLALLQSAMKAVHAVTAANREAAKERK